MILVCLYFNYFMAAVLLMEETRIPRESLYYFIEYASSLNNYIFVISFSNFILLSQIFFNPVTMKLCLVYGLVNSGQVAFISNRVSIFIPWQIKRKFLPWWSTIPLTSTKRTITSHINSLNTLEILVLAWTGTNM